MTDADMLEKAKSYLRLDSYEDDPIVTSCLGAAKEYIKAAVGDFDSTDSRTLMLLFAITQDMYDNRTLTQSEQQQKLRQQWTYQSIILQLRMEYELRKEATGEQT